MGRDHRYQATITWTGNLGAGTAGYRSYSRNPEELLVGTLSQCHMLWFLHLCAVNGIVVLSYTDDAEGIMAEGDDGAGEFTAVTLRPRAAIADPGHANRARDPHQEAGGG